MAALAGEEDLRLGVFVGNDDGRPEEEQLVFASSDARKMYDLFQTWGEMDGHSELLINRNRGAVRAALEDAGDRIEKARADGQRTLFVFYYSGHGDDEALHLGNTQVTHAEVRSWLEETGADVRIGILDACQSGSAIRKKGGRRGSSYAFAVEVEEAHGTALLTSSAASEFSQESAEIGGGFFTHYLHSALAGAADIDGDGDVTLTEAYSYVHTETAFRTREAPERQTPGFDFDMTGTGDIRLTTLEDASAWIVFPGGMDGVYAVWDETRKRYVAEVDGGPPKLLAVRPGLYYLHHRMPGWLDEAAYQVKSGGSALVSADDFTSVAYEKAASRGDLQRQVKRASRPDLMLRAVIGMRAFGKKSTANLQYIPTHSIAGIQARLLRTRRSGPYIGADVLTGGGTSVVEFEEQGEVELGARSASFGGAAGWATRAGRVPLRAGVGGRSELIWFARNFPDGELEPQGSFSVSWGIEAWAGFHYGRFSLDVEHSILLLPVRWDDVNWPLYSELRLAGGYRF